MKSSQSQRRAAKEASKPARQAKDALIAATLDCIRKDGLAKTSSRRITETAQQNLGAITYYFGSKDNLIAEAVTSAIRNDLEPVFAILESDVPALERLAQAVPALMDTFHYRQTDASTFVEAIGHATRPGPIRGQLDRLITDLQTRLATVIDQLQTEGAVAPWVHSTDMAGLLVSAAYGMATYDRLEKGHDTSVSAMASQLALLLISAQPR